MGQEKQRQEKKFFERDFSQAIIDQLTDVSRNHRITILQEFYFLPVLTPKIYAVVSANRSELEIKDSPQRKELVTLNRINKIVRDVFQSDPSVEPYEFRVVPQDESENLEEKLTANGFSKVPYNQAVSS